MANGKTGRGTVRKNSNSESRIGQIHSWCLEFPGGPGQLEAENTLSREARRKGYGITRKAPQIFAC